MSKNFENNNKMKKSEINPERRIEKKKNNQQISNENYMRPIT